MEVEAVCTRILRQLPGQVIAATIALTGGAVLAGCSSGGSPAAPAAPKSTSAPATSAPAATVDGLPISHTVAVGQPFTVKANTANGGTGPTFSVTVKSVTCGPLAPSPDPAHVPTPTPAAGQEFCTAQYSGTNTSGTSAYWYVPSGAGGVTLYAGSASYPDQSTNPIVFAYTESFQGSLGSVQNPGVTNMATQVFQINAGSHVTSLWVPDGSTVQQVVNGITTTASNGVVVQL